MAFLQLRVLSAHPEFAEELLMACGALSVSLIDADDDPVLEPAPGETPLWSRTVALGLFDIEADIEHVRNMLREHLPEGDALQLSTERVEDQDWVRVWLKDCPPLKFGERLWVCPHEKQVNEPGCVTVLLDPGLAFGTGTHPSTALCLDWIARNELRGFQVLDFGCGSGILGIATLKLGAAHCTAVDIDPQAIQATRDNAQQNAVQDRLTALGHDRVFEPFAADLVLGNILARPLIELAPLLLASLKPGGKIVLAGLLDRQADDVRAAYAAHIDFEDDQRREGWTRLAGCKRADSSGK
ncbi:50S ribosomal protein L11 methyltransferase [Panacagrimonas sp.]|uniref:50S ribosomal protein L11 methyltransferase n=1 Tax=Panacagrimonas sp. TaxID=2480088 RepID=UPI003B52DA87